jgi:hypothetical protein
MASTSPLSENPQDSRNTEDELLWDSLLEYIAAGSIVPVIGRELLTIKDAGGVERSFYAELATDLALVEDIGPGIPRRGEPARCRRVTVPVERAANGDASMRRSIVCSMIAEGCPCQTLSGNSPRSNRSASM